MFGNNGLAAKALALLLASYPLSASSEGSTARQVLAWSHDEQDALFHSSVTMIGIVASQGRKDIAGCLNDWYGSDPAVHAQRYGQFREAMALYPDFHPQAIILSVVQKACGSFSE